ncbi:putative NBD/HSP70 family sugar kinase [Motilibacter rhizosphaerae]|uniref:Putative NBD/HSP70 family sugar kinase n=1 Tax=Motilibacter rhizosphaerae TaxID=598652 RepID=A0A4Q7NZ80_9ACTN|nr:ROK family protein [Motilibacter rhizosphaerae]RZS91732.1 putative NBD/HSP70 family sugar kinase [Motilibacter rhizosphaerae]
MVEDAGAGSAAPLRLPAQWRWPLGNGSRGASSAARRTSAVAVADLRGRNAAAVLGAVRAAGEPSRVAALAEQTALSRPTIEVLVDDLKAVGLLAELPPLSSVGRPARRFVFAPAAAYVVGVDVRAGSVGACVADLDGELVSVQRKRVRRDLRGKVRAAATVDVVRRALAGAPEERPVLAAALGTPGWVQDDRRVRYVDNLRDWAEVDVAGMLEDELGCPVALDNDANLAAVGEQWRGVGQGVDDLMFVLLGERVGAGIIAGGRPLHGHHGAAGEIGFMVYPDGSRLTARTIGEGRKARPGVDPSNFYSAADVVEAAARGDREARTTLRSVGTRLAHALAPTLLALDPAMVVLGSSLFGHEDSAFAREHVIGAAVEESRALLVDPPEWAVSSLGDDAVLRGATRFALTAVEEVLGSEPLALFSS